MSNDTIIFCLGEIDCRCHINKHIKDTVTYQHIIDTIVEKYFERIELNIKILNLPLKNVCVYNIVPTTQSSNTHENHMYPYRGTDEERMQYTLYFNKKLKENCILKNYIFFDIYNLYADENGFLKKNLSDGNVHISYTGHITNFINENNI
jgi:hypothetical protein